MLTDTVLSLQPAATFTVVTFVKCSPECLAPDQAQYKLTIEMVSDSHSSMKGWLESNMSSCSPKGYPESWLFSDVYTEMSAALVLSLAVLAVRWQRWTNNMDNIKQTEIVNDGACQTISFASASLPLQTRAC